MNLHRAGWHSWPLNGFDAALVAQTYPGRPMTTHHVLEFGDPVTLAAVREATWKLVSLYPELASIVELGEWPTRFLFPAERAGVNARIFEAFDGTHAAMERWIRRPIPVDAPYPFAIRMLAGANPSIVFSLHHSVADGRGALAMFDAFLALLEGKPSRRRQRPSSQAVSGSELASVGRMFRAARRLHRPCLSLSDRSAVASAQVREVSVQTLAWERWRAIGACAGALGVSRYVLLQHAVAAAVRERVGGDLPVRILSPVDLRGALGIPPDSLQNWLGAAEVDIVPDLEPGPLQTELRRAADPQRAVATTALASTLASSVPASLSRAVFRFVDESRAAATHTLMLTRLAVPAGSCWPSRLRPQRLWCTSLLPRSPALGITVTTAGRTATVAASWQAPSLQRATVEWIIERTLHHLEQRTLALPTAA